ncbi:MAG: toxin-antitoxin system, antitoxin component, Xre family protein [Desulfobacteraceae bacterium]|nr:MAG: toxin-antitoxin system, antitoxin component, Xre family protein [Desulfobacteraceae bacterium]
MSPSNDREKILIEKIRTLSPEKITQVVDFIDFISQKDSERRLIQAANKLAEHTFKKVWNNPEDDIYDDL